MRNDAHARRPSCLISAGKRGRVAIGQKDRRPPQRRIQETIRQPGRPILGIDQPALRGEDAIARDVMRETRGKLTSAWSTKYAQCQLPCGSATTKQSGPGLVRNFVKDLFSGMRSMANTVKVRQRAQAQGRSPRNRSLERGLNILRVFRPGASLRGNAEIAERTGLPRSTVSRLTQTLVASGFLEHDRRANAYRLGALVLGLAEAWIAGSDVLLVAVPLMKRVSERLRVNVSLAIADDDEMVYLHAVRRRDIGVPRRVTTGHRIPMEETSLGRAYLATLPSQERLRLMASFRKRHPDRWTTMARDIRNAVSDVKKLGYCRADWLSGITAIATPVRVFGRTTYILGLSTSTELCDDATIRNELAPGLLDLADSLRKGLMEHGKRNMDQDAKNSVK